jgi:hypothetical protein
MEDNLRIEGFILGMMKQFYKKKIWKATEQIDEYNMLFCSIFNNFKMLEVIQEESEKDDEANAASDRDAMEKVWQNSKIPSFLPTFRSRT